MNATTPRRQLLDFIAGQGPAVIPSPLMSERIVREYLQRDWTVRQDDQRLIRGWVQIGEACGFAPVIKAEMGSLDVRQPRLERLLDTPEKTRDRYFYETPLGALDWITTRVKDSSHDDKKAIESIEDIKKLVWVQEHLNDYEAYRRKVRYFLDTIGEGGLFAVNIPLPFNVLGDRESLIYVASEEPEALHEAVDRTLAVNLQLMDIAAEEGVRVFFTAQLDSNMLSPGMIEEWQVPAAIQMRVRAHERGAVFYLHDCGNMRRKLADGVYNRIRPDWLEGFEAPPLGDIEDLHAARVALAPEIAIKGNLNIERLAQGTPEETYQATRRVLEQVRGYRHVMGSACSLLRHTPLDNIRALTQATRDFVADLRS
ncbi:MAG: uroporphyrinogen decarboxylase family protein [Candidatus Marinimicrobia bacterium]|nr:uroporphyrinogen decarboxylase family protein [Candidatus Neomarinimicrobiota bacterium]